tara:strand:+ start:122 stop:496 length:375 start_codon:yes stop_codon:yes gene_type:complete
MTKIFLAVAILVTTNTSFARNIFLNGKDISSATGQKLDKVNVFISENGDIFITAPQYQVYQEKTFVPLAKAKKRQQSAQSHPQNLPSASEMMGEDTPVSKQVKPKSIYNEDSQLKEKAGTRFID